ncbi:small secreted protein [Luteolibacter marinus]|uniref:small secreted protein n=1 Tax=Luteolibacter marinus TaxID=2776705 RepID=UPI001866FAE0|nr:small secreted protein [Luteolibacter marinus]
MKKLSVVLALAGVVSLSSCNTAIGFGRDLRQLGTGMENKAHGRTWDGQQEQSQDTLPTY